MAHLSFEYSANLEQAMNLQAFCDAMRDIMRDSDIFPLGGVRVRGTRVDVCTVADGHPDLGFIDMTVRMGQGRDAETRSRVTQTLYAGAEAWLKAALDERPFSLSLEGIDIHARVAEKRVKTLHAHLATQATNSGRDTHM